MSISITLIGNQSVLQRLEQLSRRMNDLRPAMTAIGAKLKSRISWRFETGTDPDGHPWTEWKPVRDGKMSRAEYIAQDKGRENSTILDRLGDMFGGLGFQADKNGVTVGFDKPYAAYHEFGTTKMPRRGLLFADPKTRMLSSDDERTVLEILDRFLRDAVR